MMQYGYLESLIKPTLNKYGLLYVELLSFTVNPVNVRHLNESIDSGT